MNEDEYNTFASVFDIKLDKFFKMHKGCDPESGLYHRIISELEKILILKTLNHTYGVQLHASKILGINRNTLRKKIKNLGINIKDQ